MKEIIFSANWNNKLGCIYFTTLRLHDQEKYRVGETYFIRGVGFAFYAELVNIRIVPLKKVTDFMACVDTGYPLPDALEILKGMYPEADDETQLDFLLLHRLPR